MTKIISATRQFFNAHHLNGWVLFLFGVYAVLVVKLITLKFLDQNLFFGAYSLLVTAYILTRFLISHYYNPEESIFNRKYHPTVTFAVPAKNEADAIKETILRIAHSDYPKHLFNIIAINDGSTDNTYQEMLEAKNQAAKMGVWVEVVNWTVNRGKRDGMTECVKRSTSDIIVFIDSDSFVEKSTVRELVKYFVDDHISAVVGHAYVTNANTNYITKMQAVRYFVAFKAYKSAEAIFGCVTCCSGCCTAYRRRHVLEVLDVWSQQTFLGVKCTYGDDRSLTNYLLEKGYRTLYAPDAAVYTFVPDTFRKFMRQQLRWKKSWVRESFKAGLFMWKKNPLMSLSFYIGVILPLLAPIVVLRALIWYPLVTNRMPYFYLFGLGLMALVYGLYYYLHTRERRWVFGVVFATFYTLILIWQLPYAILNLRDARWGTR